MTISVPTEKGKTMAKINKDDLRIGVTFTPCKECDRVEVVRCKDCKHYDKYGCAEGFGWCGLFDYGMMDNDYCSHGGRRTNETD